MGEASEQLAAEVDDRFTIFPARTQRDMEAVASLFTFYAESLGIDLSFQDFHTELASLPGMYDPSNGGEVLLARSSGGEPIGCVALRRLAGAHECCEMKRLYVAPTGRGMGLGKGLATAIIDIARDLKYHTMKLDSLPTMSAALALYRKLGFVETEAYYHNPIAEARFLAKGL
ncbi:MAG: hypothetical protein LQ338_007855 [Usnochroma carphineum]|nr:MAG: hypothetical protein LQ338_007855 [Usnochroma carphineum]